MTRPSRALVPLLCALAALATSGCKAECEQNLNCPADQVCTDGKCAARLCLDSSTCPMETFCSDEDGTCKGGCQGDRDCYPYHRCDEDGRCVENGCRNTSLDCGLGQFCNELTGECFDAGGAYCHTCEVDSDCGGSSFCLDIGAPGGQRYCLVDCSMGQECPRGYPCVDIVNGGGAVVGMGCYARCWEI